MREYFAILNILFIFFKIFIVLYFFFIFNLKGVIVSKIKRKTWIIVTKYIEKLQELKLVSRLSKATIRINKEKVYSKLDINAWLIKLTLRLEIIIVRHDPLPIKVNKKVPSNNVNPNEPRPTVKHSKQLIMGLIKTLMESANVHISLKKR